MYGAANDSNEHPPQIPVFAYAHGERVYRVTMSHPVYGMYDSPDWEVNFEQLKSGTFSSYATFLVGKKRGKLLDVTIR